MSKTNIASYDVIVVGGGNAALVSALSAHQSGARVAIFEAAPEAEHGGNSRFSSGIFRIPHSGLSEVTALLDEAALDDVKHCRMAAYPAEQYKGDIERTSKGHCDRAQVDVMLKHAFETVRWMKDDIGVKWQLPLGKFFDREKIIAAQGVVDMPPWDTVMAIGEGTGLMEALWDAVRERPGIAVFHESPVSGLIADGDTVSGVTVRRRDTTLRVYGQVILACGGFEASPRLRRQYLGEGWDLVALRGSRFNTGTMMEQAVGVGAAAVGNFGGCHATPHDLDAPKILNPSDADRMSRYSFPYSVMVNAEGRRFMDEGENVFSLTYAKTGAAIVKQPHATAFQVFDQKTLHLLEPRYSVASPVEADTLEELAHKIGVDANTFTTTIEKYNSATLKDATERFHAFACDGVSTGTALDIPKSNWALPIDKPPFVAYGVTCGITFTYGGLRVDNAARVLNDEGLVMPGLWAVGEIAGGFFAFNYPGGSGLTKGAVFGKLAGQSAAERARNIKLA
ncbi:FAD binding domain-containing protein [Aspergillus undulatus]|uniref:FAD binding domain-containing protein n=1 Tax=Aspergillus undulatus TaxID=1810928 RepID=UPI003CCD3D0B